MENVIINFDLVKISTEQFAVFKENFHSEGKIKLNTSLTFGLNTEEKIFVVTPNYIFECDDKPMIIIQVNCFFKIEEQAWTSFVKGKKISFPKKFVAHMTMITVGTSRGILHTKTENTIFNEFVLPTLNVAAMIEKNVDFDI
jgi:hypothetical protein